MAKTEPFVKAGLPIKDLPNRAKERRRATAMAVWRSKNPPHPNATKVLANWLLGKEGQEKNSRTLLAWHAPIQTWTRSGWQKKASRRLKISKRER